MQELIGQENLIKTFEAFTLESMPRTILLLGEEGCGKHLFIKKLSERFLIQTEDLTETFSVELLQDLLIRATPTFYIIDLAKFTEKQQNQFLKFIEEPPISAYIILVATSEAGILPTVLNRCVKYKFKNYSTVELKKLYPNISNNLVFDICKTPGQLENIDEIQIAEMYKCCEESLKNIKVNKYASFILMANLINYKDEYNKFDFNLFLSAISLAAFNLYKNSNDNLYFDLYKIIAEKRNEIVNKPINKEAFIINFLSILWQVAHDNSRA